MEFTKESFIKFCRLIVKRGTTLNLEIYGDELTFGYFEIKPYVNESVIKYNIHEISNSSDGIMLNCSVGIGEFSIGSAVVYEYEFLRYAQGVSLYGNFDNEIMEAYILAQN